MSCWYLEGFIEKSKTMSRVNLSSLPFAVGRQPGLPLTLPSIKASRIHAEFVESGNLLLLKDLDSTNGSFINTARVHGQQEVSHGDIIHFADCEFRIMQESRELIETEAPDDATLVTGPEALSENLPTGIKHLQELLEKQTVTALYQPVVGNDFKTLFGYEILGRGSHPQLSQSPHALFDIAASFDLAENLSELFRDYGLKLAGNFPLSRYFFNIHPDELRDYNRLVRSLTRLRELYPDFNLVFEVHEQAVSDPQHMRQIKSDLENLDIELAYDDFGAGQARLLELVEVPPHYLKFDHTLIRGIDQANETRVDMVRYLVDIAQKMGSKTIAECAETAGEVETCKRIGFDLFQGYFIERPMAEPTYFYDRSM